MRKILQTIALAMLCLIFTTKAQAQVPIKSSSLKSSYTGKVISGTNGEALPGAIIKVTTTNQTLVTNDRGEFSINLADGSYNLSIHYLSYKAKKLNIQVPLKEQLIISLDIDEQNLQEVEIVSTGYQNIPKERATGSFTLIDNELLNRKVSTNILDRLDGVVNGLIFNRGVMDGNNKSDITIRGRSTIFANPNPLIVLDKFPYEGDINDINPNDIENITILKDAAAASIWGVRAGNGVIVITSKRGSKSQLPLLTFNSNVTIALKPDLWYPSQMSSSDYIDLEKFLFEKGVYNNTLNNAYLVVSPAVELMNSLKKNKINVEEYELQINKLKQNDVRHDLDKYIYRTAINQQYNINISGGGDHQKYYISGGLDNNLASKLTNNYRRLTLNANNTYNLIRDKLEIFSSISLTKSKSGSNTGNYNPYTPYEQLADNNGNARAVVRSSTLRASYTDTAGAGKLLDWRYYPLNENKSDAISSPINYRLLTGLTYKLTDHFNIQLNYQYELGQTDQITTKTQDSYFTRDFINKFSTINSLTKEVNRIVPLGDIVYKNRSTSETQYARAQLIYQKNIGSLHYMSALAGVEVKDYHNNSINQILYGYDPISKKNSNDLIDPLAEYKIYYNQFATSMIPTSPGELGSIDRYRSFYANMAYTYHDKYTFNASARKDETNIFGVKSNQKGVPLWSAGISWELSREKFFSPKGIQYLKLRFTYGHNGNADKTTSAYLTAIAAGVNSWGNLYSKVLNPPNPSLRWEKVKNINLGADFSMRGNWLSGSIEYYLKSGIDLIGNSPIAAQTGVTVFKGNTANTQTSGVDLVANLTVLKKSRLKWFINALYNYNTDKITSYKLNQSTNGDIVYGNYNNPLVGYPYYSIFSFKSAGLDASGNPQGFFNGKVSSDYAGITDSNNAAELVFSGSATPTSFGNIRNTFSIKNWEFSFNILYRLGYYFKRTNEFSGSNYTFKQGDYNKRWQKPGDELNTTVPSQVYPNNAYRDIFYLGSTDLIEKGDHLRLQDLKLSYQLSQSDFRAISFKSIRFYAYINNIGILWRANNRKIDPDAGTLFSPAVRTYSFGLTANF